MTYRLPVYKLKLVRDHVATYPAPHASEPQLAALFFHRLIGNADREHVAALFLDSQGKPTGSTIIGIGVLSSAKVHAREVFKSAIVANAAGIVLAHNHPSNCPTPSDEDVRSTRGLVRAGELLGIPVLDHIIVTPSGGFVSMFEAGLMCRSGRGPWTTAGPARVAQP